MARLGHRGGQQRHHLPNRNAHRAIWIRSGKPVLHGALRKQPMELAEQQMRTKAKRLGVFAFFLAIGSSNATPAHAQAKAPAETKRQAKHLVTPNVSDLAKKLNLSGTVRIEILIGPDGTVKKTRVIGGNPVLAMDAETAAQKSTFMPGPTETTEVIEFKF
jgi:outer membrane biosynthesis protein TonB